MTDRVRIPIAEEVDGKPCHIEVVLCKCGGSPTTYRDASKDKSRVSHGIFGAVGISCKACNAKTRECLAESPACAANEAAALWNGMNKKDNPK